MTKIMIVEDNVAYREKIKGWLIDAGHEVLAVDNPILALDLFQDDQYELIISDYMMEPMSGVQLLKYLKRINLEVKSILLTGLESSDVELLALNISVDQFLRKNVSKEVLLKYIEIIMGRNKKVVVEDEDMLYSEKENITINLKGHEVRHKGEIVALTHKEYEFLKVFLRNKGIVLSREEILNNLWEEEKEEIMPRVVDTHVKLLRQKLKLSAIQSIRGVGYKWNE